MEFNKFNGIIFINKDNIVAITKDFKYYSEDGYTWKPMTLEMQEYFRLYVA